MKMCTAFSRIGHEVVLLTIKRPGSHQKDVESDFDFYGVEPLFEIRKFYVPQMKSSIFLYSLRCAIETLKIYEMHFTERQMSRVGRLLFSNLVKKRKLKHLVVISQALKEMIEDNVSRKKIIVAHDGADLIGNNNKEVQTELFDPRGQKTKVGYIGHLYPGRGIELIFKMARELPGIDFHIIGGAEEDIKTRKREAEGKNIFFHGFVPPSLINSYIRHCDILVMPYQRRVTISGDKASDTSRWMSPLKMFEYMASGRPIIASDLPVLREVLDHERNAILVVPDDINGWVRSIQFLADDQKTRERLAKQALIDLKQSYTWERRAQRVLAGN
jgi:glycosyltransferase involved in cell wall biosynthesis